MAQRVTDTLTGINTTGTKNPQTLTQAPELTFTAQAKLSAGGVSATVRLVAWVISSTEPETLSVEGLAL